MTNDEKLKLVLERLSGTLVEIENSLQRFFYDLHEAGVVSLEDTTEMLEKQRKKGNRHA